MSLSFPRPRCIALLFFSPWLPGLLQGGDEWEPILQQSLTSEYSQTRHDGLKQVDASTVKGLRALWKVLAMRDPNKMDWFVREGAYEALMNAQGEEAEKEIDRVIKGAEDELAREAIVYSVTWKLRKEVIKEYGENDDRKIEELKYQLRKKRGVDYFDMVLPVAEKFDPEKKYLQRIQVALNDKSPRVRRAALTGLTAYPDNSSVPLLLENLKKLEKQKAKVYREWVLTRYALEMLTGQYFRERVEDWFKWWEITKESFSLEKRVEEEKGKDEENLGKTIVVKREGVEVRVHMKVAGLQNGYPLLVIPWEDHEADYFRPYFHGIEEFLRVYYLRVPQLDDYKGLAREEKANLVSYPTKLLAGAVADLMKETGLKKFGLLAHGAHASTLGMMFCAEYPGRVSHLVLINPRSAGDAYHNVLENIRRYGLKNSNKEIVKAVDSISLTQEWKPKYKAADAAEQGGMNRALDNLLYADPTEPETGALDYLYDLPGGTSTLNDNKWSAKSFFAGKKLDFQALILMGEKCPSSPLSDMMVVTGVLKQATVVKLPDASETPFISDTYAFTKHLEKFFQGAKAPPKEGEEEGEKKPKGKVTAGK